MIPTSAFETDPLIPAMDPMRIGIEFIPGSRCDSPGCNSLCVATEHSRGYCCAHHGGRASNMAHWILDLGISLGLKPGDYYAHLCRIGIREYDEETSDQKET